MGKHQLQTDDALVKLRALHSGVLKQKSRQICQFFWTLQGYVFIFVCNREGMMWESSLSLPRTQANLVSMQE